MTKDDVDLIVDLNLRLSESLAEQIQREELLLAGQECGCSSRGRCMVHNSIDYARRLVSEARVVADRILHPERKSA